MCISLWCVCEKRCVGGWHCQRLMGCSQHKAMSSLQHTHWERRGLQPYEVTRSNMYNFVHNFSSKWFLFSSCRKCRKEFCWICMQDWSMHSDNTGGYFQCNKFVESTPKDSGKIILSRMTTFGWYIDGVNSRWDGLKYLIDEYSIFRFRCGAFFQWWRCNAGFTVGWGARKRPCRDDASSRARQANGSIHPLLHQVRPCAWSICHQF